MYICLRIKISIWEDNFVVKNVYVYSGKGHGFKLKRKRSNLISGRRVRTQAFEKIIKKTQPFSFKNNH
jgi:hypothetical protein